MDTQHSPPPHRRLLAAAGAFIVRLLWAAVNLYSLLLGAYLVLRLLFGERLWPVALANNFTPWLLLPSLILLPLALWQRRWIVSGITGAGVLLFGWWFGPLFLPQPRPDIPPETRTLTVMSYNALADATDPQALLALIADTSPDIIGIQELSQHMADILDRELADEYPYRHLYGYGIPGGGLLSRFPVVENNLFFLRENGLSHLHATLDVDGTPLSVLTVHPPPPGLDRHTFTYRVNPGAADEIATLTAMATTGGPAIMVGDFNTTDQSDHYALVANAGLIDAFRATGWGFGVTWPARRIQGVLPTPPLTRIDYVWHTAHFYPLRAWVGPSLGSDHLPVLAELAWLEDGPAN